jgi:hypothetical protein
MSDLTFPKLMLELYKFREDLTIKKRFDYVLDFLAYIVKVDNIATPSVPEGIFDKMISLGKQYIKEPLNFDLLDLYYELKIGIYARPKFQEKNIITKFEKLHKPVILAQHNNIRAGDAILMVKNAFPNKNIIHYGYCHSITEYHITLICSKIFGIDSYVLCIDKDFIDKKDSPALFNLNHMFINQWKKPAKKDVRRREDDNE